MFKTKLRAWAISIFLLGCILGGLIIGSFLNLQFPPDSKQTSLLHEAAKIVGITPETLGGAIMVGILAIGFLIMTFVSPFLFGSTFYWVSEKANTRSHLFMFLALLSGGFWAIAKSPENITVFIFCLLPMAILLSAFSYGVSLAQRKFIEWVAPKMNIGPKNPFKNPFRIN